MFSADSQPPGPGVRRLYAASIDAGRVSPGKPAETCGPAFSAYFFHSRSHQVPEIGGA